MTLIINSPTNKNYFLYQKKKNWNVNRLINKAVTNHVLQYNQLISCTSMTPRIVQNPMQKKHDDKKHYWWKQRDLEKTWLKGFDSCEMVFQKCFFFLHRCIDVWNCIQASQKHFCQNKLLAVVTYEVTWPDHRPVKMWDVETFPSTFRVQRHHTGHQTFPGWFLKW